MNTPTLASNPRLYLRNRANRLERLCTLDAPAVVLNAEVRLIDQANDVLLRKEAPDLLTVLASNGFLTEAALRETHTTCMNTLAGVPGETLEQRVTRIVDDYVALHLQLRA